MRTALIFLLLESPALAQDKAPTIGALSACGPANVKFEVNLDQTQPPSGPPSDKALVYMIEDRGQSTELVGGVNVRVGPDGAWVGANKGNTYFSFLVPPGEHHLCSNWQSSLATYAAYHSVTNFTAEVGKIYYFRTRLWFSDKVPFLDLDEINSDEGRYLVSTSSLAVSRAKK
jgi:hypothetical protein